MQKKLIDKQQNKNSQIAECFAKQLD